MKRLNIAVVVAAAVVATAALLFPTAMLVIATAISVGLIGKSVFAIRAAERVQREYDDGGDEVATSDAVRVLTAHFYGELTRVSFILPAGCALMVAVERFAWPGAVALVGWLLTGKGAYALLSRVWVYVFVMLPQWSQGIRREEGTTEEAVQGGDITLRIPRRPVMIIGLILAAFAAFLSLRPLIDAGYRKLVPAFPTPIGRDVTHVVMDTETPRVVFGGVWGHPGTWRSPVLTLPAGDVHYYLYSDGGVEFTVRRVAGSPGRIEPFTALAEGDRTESGTFTITAAGDFLIDVRARTFWQLQLDLVN